MHTHAHPHTCIHMRVSAYASNLVCGFGTVLNRTWRTRASVCHPKIRLFAGKACVCVPNDLPAPSSVRYIIVGPATCLRTYVHISDNLSAIDLFVRSARALQWQFQWQFHHHHRRRHHSAYGADYWHYYAQHTNKHSRSRTRSHARSYVCENWCSH